MRGRGWRCDHVSVLLVVRPQLHFGILDLELHSTYDPSSGETVFQRDAKVAERTQVRLGGTWRWRRRW